MNKLLILVALLFVMYFMAVNVEGYARYIPGYRYRNRYRPNYWTYPYYNGFFNDPPFNKRNCRKYYPCPKN